MRNKVGENKRGLFSAALFVFADKQKENEKLRESLSRKAASLELLQREYACVKGDNERLQSEVRERERHTQQLLREVCSSRSELSRWAQAPGVGSVRGRCWCLRGGRGAP